MSYGMISILKVGSLRSPHPIRLRRTFHLKVKRFTMICASLALLQIMFAVHPRESVSHDSQVALLPYESCSLATPSGDRINRSMLSCRDMAPWLSIHSPTTKWGEGGGASHQRGNAFPRAKRGWTGFRRPQGGCKGFRCPRQRHIKLPSEPARSVGRTHHSVRSTRTIEPGRRKAPEPSSPKGACP